MRNDKDPTKVAALYSLEQQKWGSSNYTTWFIRFVTSHPRGIAPRKKGTVDPWKERHKLSTWLQTKQMRVYAEESYTNRDFSYFSNRNDILSGDRPSMTPARLGGGMDYDI
jgi:hypothetical protein